MDNMFGAVQFVQNIWEESASFEMDGVLLRSYVSEPVASWMFKKRPLDLDVEKQIHGNITY